VVRRNVSIAKKEKKKNEKCEYVFWQEYIHSIEYIAVLRRNDSRLIINPEMFIVNELNAIIRLQEFVTTDLVQY